MGVPAEIFSSALLFSLVFGMSATVDINHMLKQIRNWRALMIGVSLQFMILPFIGFLVVKILKLDAVIGITLLVVTSSPGGSYSNWWCSMFNADLALSVTMTAVSTLLSTVMLPLNLVLYTRWTYSPVVVKSLDWTALFVSLLTVCTGIACGLAASAVSARHGHAQQVRFHQRANRLGNVAGLALITLSITVSSSTHQAAIWDQDASFYIGVALPAVLGLGMATYMATRFRLDKPERVAVAVEACYQNTGIATSVALTMFDSEEDLATAIGVPLYYGIVEAVILGIFCLVCWKLNWTKAPADDNICKVITNSYEVEEESEEEQEVSVEVVLGADGMERRNDLIFEQTSDGAYIVDAASLQDIVEKGKKDAFDIKRASKKAALSVPEEEREGHTEQIEHSDEDDVLGHSLRRRPYAPVEAPSSQTVTESSRSSSNEETDAAAASTADAAQNGRLGRTISVLRARATGYRKAPLPREDGIYEEDSRIQAPPSFEVDTEEPSSDYQTIAVTSPTGEDTSRVPTQGRTLD